MVNYRSGASGLSVVRSTEVVRFSEVPNVGKINRGHGMSAVWRLSASRRISGLKVSVCVAMPMGNTPA